jgi:hypothetical protein
MTSALRSLANTEFWSTPISKSCPVSDLNRLSRSRENCKAQVILHFWHFLIRADPRKSAVSLFLFRSASSVVISGKLLLSRSRRSPDLFSYSSASFVPLCFKGFAFRSRRSPDHARSPDLSLSLRFPCSSAFQRFCLSDYGDYARCRRFQRSPETTFYPPTASDLLSHSS